jgi:HEAT repeat protein
LFPAPIAVGAVNSMFDHGGLKMRNGVVAAIAFALCSCQNGQPTGEPQPGSTPVAITSEPPTPNVKVSDTRPVAIGASLVTNDEKRHSKDVKALIQQLQSEDESKRTAASEALADLGPDAAPAVPALIAALASKTPLRRPFSGGILTWWDHSPIAARQALVRVGQKAVPDLENALKDKDALTRVHAASALWEITKQSKLPLPVLLEVWRNRNHNYDDICIHREATETIGRIAQSEPDRLLKLIVKALDEDAWMVDEVTRALRILGEKDKRGVEHLYRLMSADGDYLYVSAGRQLRELESAGVPLLVSGLKSDNPELRGRCAWVLGGMKSTDAAPAIPALKACLKDDSTQVRKWAAWALECIEEKTFDNRFD